MSLETGKKLGFTSSLIFVIIPIVQVALMLSVIAAVFSNLSLNGVTPGSVPSGLGLFGAGLGVVWVALGILGLVALVLLLIAMHNLSQYYKEPGIFTNILYAVIILIVTVAVLFAFVFVFVISNIASISTTTTPSTAIGSYFLGLIAVGVVAIVMGIISAVLVMRSFNLLGEKSGVDSFKTVGLLYLIGVLLSIILIGAIITWIAFIFAVISFNRLKPLPPISVPVTYPPQVPPPTSTVTKRCPYCQTENVVGATYCRFCGKPLT